MTKIPPTVTGYHVSLKSGHTLMVTPSETGAVFQILTVTPKRKHNIGVRREVLLKRNTAAIVAGLLMHELGCNTADELYALIDQSQINLPT
jgi:hypothetical protein